MSAFTEQYLETAPGSLHYYQAGVGPRLLLAFHGYGGTGAIFQPFVPPVGDQFTMLAPDLPYHGKTHWSKPSVSKDDIMTVVRALMMKHDVEKVSLLGYSMGARVCLAIMEEMPDAVDRVVLMAADGLIVEPFYHFVSRTAIGNAIFRAALARPKQLIKLVDTLQKRKLLKPWRHKFIIQHIETERSRAFVQQVWMGMRMVTPDYKKLRQAIVQYHMPITIFMGAHDRIIPPANARLFMRELDTVSLHLLDKGHRLFDYENAGQIAQYLL
jgi:pimeloyl-ACP methyl ester carboxylesterase